MRGGTEKILGLFIPIFLLLFLARPAGSSMMDGGKDGNGEADIPDVVLRNVTVTPVRAHVGDVIRIEMEWDYWGDITKNYYDTNKAAVRANGKWWPARRTPPTSEYARENSAGRRSCGIRRGWLRGSTASGEKCP